MARFSLSLRRNAERTKRIVVVLTIWLQLCNIVSSLLILLASEASLFSYRPRVRRYLHNFYANRDYLRRILHDNDESCISMVRMNRQAFFKLCEMLESMGGLKTTKNMLIDEQVGIFLHIIAHHVKNRVIGRNFRRSGETVSRCFHNVLNAVMHLQELLFKKPEPIPTNSLDHRWRWFKNCLGALDGTYIRVNVPIKDKARFRTRKGDIATNMLGVCTPNMQFVYVLPGWEGSVADGRVLRDAITRRHGLKVPHGCYYLVDAGYTNCEGFLAPFRGQRDDFYINPIVEEEPITAIDPTNAWTNWRIGLAREMFNEWQTSRQIEN
ncbi:hypothetical protein K2173_009729 [Erythroxylum novogranatense]|uniref:DDE Tnp4 domain-containing protein n=1 Tax=Erythroxylum novogranatense TaxID=1862640 RepID=A0AAV8U4Y5_9ROSI|nr:hypothetical protein K2173_009729 [Erythroxylum novogranatense]